jgi:hypothetical protein
MSPNDDATERREAANTLRALDGARDAEIDELQSMLNAAIKDAEHFERLAAERLDRLHALEAELDKLREVFVIVDGLLRRYVPIVGHPR